MKASHALILLALGASSLALAGQAQAQPADGKEHARQEKKGAQRQTNAQREDELFAQLGLSPDQQTQVQALRQKYDAQLEPGKGQTLTRDEMKKLRAQRDEELAKILTPEQHTKWEQLNARHAGGGVHRSAGGHHKAAAPAPGGASGQAAPGGGK